jgi:actin cytoskeleton-regulatory complex protein PAN1
MVTGIVSSPNASRAREQSPESSILETNSQDPSRLSVTSDTLSINSDTDDDGEGSSWSSDDDGSFAESEPSNGEEQEMTEEQRKEEREARALERQRVLEAAGLIIKSDRKPPPRPARFVRRKSSHKRRPAPAVPEHRRHESKDLPSLPGQDSPETSMRLDDAYERYEAYKQSNANLNRLSMVSVDSVNALTSPSSAGIPRSPSVVSATSTEGRTHSHFLHFFGRKTPANDGEAPARPVISGPILQEKEPGSPSGDDSGFGTVSDVVLVNRAKVLIVAAMKSWSSLVDKSALEEIPTKERRRQEAIFELIVTEAAYVRDLQLIVEVGLPLSKAYPPLTFFP